MILAHCALSTGGIYVEIQQRTLVKNVITYAFGLDINHPDYTASIRFSAGSEYLCISLTVEGFIPLFICNGEIGHQ